MHATTFSGRHLMSRNAKAWKLKRAVLQNEEPCKLTRCETSRS